MQNKLYLPISSLFIHPVWESLLNLQRWGITCDLQPAVLGRTPAPKDPLARMETAEPAELDRGQPSLRLSAPCRVPRPCSTNSPGRPRAPAPSLCPPHTRHGASALWNGVFPTQHLQSTKDTHSTTSTASNQRRAVRPTYSEAWHR